MRYPIIIAEAGNNHEGSVDAALELLERAKESGADLVKFQAGRAEGFARSAVDVERYRKYELGREGYGKLIARGAELEIPVFFSVWSEEFADYRDLKFYKIAARQCGQKLITRNDRPNVFVSIPDTFVGYLEIKNATPLHCVASYPAWNPFLERIRFLKKYFGRSVGYSDHTIGVKACIEAAAWGAVALEKHFTLAHDFGPLRDHALSATPDEMKMIVEEVKGRCKSAE